MGIKYNAEESYRFFDSIQSTDSLWTGRSAICKCAHHITDHPRNDHPSHGHCMAPGCNCVYFKAYRHISQEVVP